LKKEYTLALSLLVAGTIGLGGVYFYKKSQDKPSSTLTQKNTQTQTPIAYNEEIIVPPLDVEYEETPEVEEYIKDLEELYARKEAILPMREALLNQKQKIAQKVALQNPEFKKDTIENGKLLHNDITKVDVALPSMLSKKEKDYCIDEKTHENKCYVVEKYNFAKNSTTRAIVNVHNRQVVAVKHYPNTQPDINARLTQIAKSIALNNPIVQEKWGRTPTPNDITMSNVRSNLQESPCEDKNHLCVAPTLPDQKNQRALWAVVDLTKLRLAIAKWAPLGKTFTPACIDERTLENRYIMKNYCEKDHNVSKDGWSFKYHLTGSDGLEIRELYFNGEKVAKSLKIVDWHVAYKGYGADKLDTSTPAIVEGRQVEFVKGENNEYTFGYNDAMGCPMFSTSVVLAFNGPEIKPLVENNETVGFYIVQDFRNPKWPMACNYRYQNKFLFYKDGSFRVVAVNLGRGCSSHAIYRPVMRLDIDLEPREEFALYKDGSWQKWQIEGDYRSTGAEEMYKGKYLYRFSSIEDEKKGFYVEPNRGQFNDNSRSDHEHIFVTKFKEEEGDEDMLTLGSCCKLDEDGVEQFVDGEVIENSDIVFWYVPTIYNDDRAGHEYCWADSTIDEYGNPSVKVWPCIVGPKFVPIKNVDKE
jgi:hypothetical protein